MTQQQSPSAPRVAAIVGPYTSGKTTLLEAMLATAGAIKRRGTVSEGNTVGDASPEARARGMSTEVNVVSATYLGDDWTFLDCPGNVELVQDSHNALMVCDAAIVVCEPDSDKSVAISPLLKFLDDYAIPHLIFVNKMDTDSVGVKATLEALQDVSDRPLILRELPIREDNKITGFVDLVSERAFAYQDGKPSELISLPDPLKDRESAERTEMLEAIADFDDGLLEKLLEDVVPSTDEVYNNLTRDLRDDKIVPVFFGSAVESHGVTRLLKALRHEAPGVESTAQRLGIEAKGETVAQVFKTLHAAHTGKQSLARVWRGELTDGMTLNGTKVSGVHTFEINQNGRLTKAGAGQIVGLGRLEKVDTGDLLSPSSKVESLDWAPPLTPMFALAIATDRREDEVKLSGALAKLAEEDPSYRYGHDSDTGELLLWGQGDVHIRVALDRLKARFNVSATGHQPQVAYKETIRKGISQHARHKKQSGGHGEFGDVHMDIKPLPRGSGLSFDEKITGGAVPKQYIPAVEHGFMDYCRGGGPLGFPVVDVAVTLTDGQYHNVDSSEMAFKKASARAMRDGMPQCSPVLLEPICSVEISVPNVFTSKVQRLVSGRRGQILGYTAKEGWNGWDVVQANLPQAEMHDLVIELRSLTLGVGTFSWAFDHLTELSGKVADKIVSARAAED